MDRLRKNFLWSGSNEVKKVHWVSWETVTTTKAYGGLGIAKLADVNLALVAKWAWRFTVEKDALWRKVVEAIHGGRGQLFPQVSEEDVIQNVPPEVIPTQEIQETLPINIHPPITETVETASVEEHAPLELAPVAEPIQQMEEAAPVTAQPTTTDPMQTTTIEEHEPLQPILAQQPPHEPESSHATKKPKHN
ncbi:RNA-directed DNA polymerase, eukaryota, Reverse transcriptase zinc-binding domain protein [Artemisia annua]|uniref:RNA-directed DNA polymerase, eukaryota, Reverse transcriptase zinc-binding domain protein n=1 Tax=Artemisia annua TaxID=35608 RepID=A0A2U1KLX2_ARTAN|nr:RNA-directed DNA polymerase, eukaryota, Reverse transcriptase zinc-binding domain protein [Artemisia annua]